MSHIFRETIAGAGHDGVMTSCERIRAAPDHGEQDRTPVDFGGFVFQQVHNILTDVPPENIPAMLDAVLDQGGSAYARA